MAQMNSRTMPLNSRAGVPSISQRPVATPITSKVSRANSHSTAAVAREIAIGTSSSLLNPARTANYLARRSIYISARFGLVVSSRLVVSQALQRNGGERQYHEGEDGNGYHHVTDDWSSAV